MGSPFPGVDPFIEGQGVWRDFHYSFILCWREALMRRLPKSYVARIEEPTLPHRPSRLDDVVLMRHIEIRRRSDDGVVTVLELLSPFNKQVPEQSEYLTARDQWRIQRVNLIEVDLLLSGVRMPFQQPLPEGDFYAMVSRAKSPLLQYVWSWRLQDRLPTIPIPLEGSDEEIVSDLHEVYMTTFDRGPFDRLVQYDEPVGIALNDATQAWVNERLRLAGY